jgi:protein gp37
MGAKTKVQWTWRLLPDGTLIPGYSYNPWWGCQKIAEECKNCYALDIANHYIKENLWGPAANTPRRLFGESHWREPLLWNRKAQQQGHRRSVFCASMADVFELHPQLDSERLKLWDLIEKTPWLNWLLLTKRPENVLSMAPWPTASPWPDNVWIGTSAGTQKRANDAVRYLLDIPAVVRFVSCEPQLEFVDFTPWLPELQWMICGGESGAHARPFNLDWARALRDACEQYQVPFFFKQVGGRYHDSGGRDLDGRTWDEMPPEVPALVRAA